MRLLYRHPSVLTAAVVAQPDEKWGETPRAFVELKEGATAVEHEIIDFCRERIVAKPQDRVSSPRNSCYALARMKCIRCVSAAMPRI